MRILFIDVNCKNSSTGQIVYSLFSSCKQNNIEAAVCYGRGPKINEPNIYKFGLDWETRIHAFLTRLTGYMGKYSYFSTKRLINYIKTFNPDVVHIHELHSYFVNINSLINFLKKSHIKTVITNHCEFLYTGKCGQAKDCLRFTENCGSCPLKKEYPKSLFFDRTRKMLSDKKRLFYDWNDVFLVSPSNWLKDRLSLSHLKDKKIYIVHNGINTHLYRFIRDDSINHKYDIPKDKKIVLSIAPNLFSEQKGGYYFLDLAKRFIKRDDLLFIAVGANNIPTLVPKNVLVLPLIKDKEDIVKLYSISHCSVICSSTETFPTTSIESQCCGTKVVGFDAGGVKETILDNNGLVVPYKDLDMLEKVVNDLLNNDYSKPDVSNYSISKFSEETMFKKYLNIYKEII